MPCPDFGLSPFPIWMDGDKLFGIAGFLNFLPKGWEKNAPAMSKAQDAALAKQAPALTAAIAKTPAGAVVFRNVKLYDSDARKFRDGMTVVVENGKITMVGHGLMVKMPANARVIDGTGKTLVPGLWDNHQHYGDDWTGPLLLASGITSVRDPGNVVIVSMDRKRRIDSGELLGPRIVPSLLIDGAGPYTAQVGVTAHNLDEALADVHRAKDGGLFRYQALRLDRSRVGEAHGGRWRTSSACASTAISRTACARSMPSMTAMTRSRTSIS